MSEKVLLVDDDASVLEVFEKLLRTRFEVRTALGGELGLQTLSTQGPFAVVIADMIMPNMTGVEFLEQVREQSPDTVRVMLTGNADQQTAVEAVNQGQIYQFLNKPCTLEVLSKAVEKSIQKHRVIKAERDLLESTLKGSIRMLMEVVAATDPDTFKHSERVHLYAGMYTAACKVNCAWELERAALLAGACHPPLPPQMTKKSTVLRPLSPAERNMFTRIPE